MTEYKEPNLKKQKNMNLTARYLSKSKIIPTINGTILTKHIHN